MVETIHKRDQSNTDKQTAKPIVEYKNVQKSYGDVEVLKGLNLSIFPGEKVALIGPSGSGKTTIIRSLY